MPTGSTRCSEFWRGKQALKSHQEGGYETPLTVTITARYSKGRDEYLLRWKSTQEISSESSRYTDAIATPLKRL